MGAHLKWHPSTFGIQTPQKGCLPPCDGVSCADPAASNTSTWLYGGARLDLPAGVDLDYCVVSGQTRCHGQVDLRSEVVAPGGIWQESRRRPPTGDPARHGGPAMRLARRLLERTEYRADERFS